MRLCTPGGIPYDEPRATSPLDGIVKWVIVLMPVVVLSGLCWTLDHVSGTFVDPLGRSSFSREPGE